MAVNKFIGIGNMGADPEVRYMADGKAVTNVNIAITEVYKDKNGQKKETTEWVNVVFFGRLAEIVGEFCAKGSQIYVEGKLKTEKFEKEGQQHYRTKVVGEKMQLLRSKERPKQNDDDVYDLPEDIPF